MVSAQFITQLQIFSIFHTFFFIITILSLVGVFYFVKAAKKDVEQTVKFFVSIMAGFAGGLVVLFGQVILLEEEKTIFSYLIFFAEALLVIGVFTFIASFFYSMAKKK